MKVAIMGGTGVYDPSILEGVHTKEVTTPYGEARMEVGSYHGIEVAFMPRHGKDHSIPPHKINYRANMAALKKLGVTQILATNAVGSANRNMKPGDFVLADQFLDFTKSREHTFFDGVINPVVHTDVTDPYCEDLRACLLQAGRHVNLNLHERGCYACFEGPRFETAAEVRMTNLLGGDIIGMTGVPEASLAREAGICYATVCMVTNMGAGISPLPLTHEEVLEIMDANTKSLRDLLMQALRTLPTALCCVCGKEKTQL